ncbi:MAG: serine protease, partial [Bacteroidota bacterium]
FRDGESLGFAVQVKYLRQNLEDYKKHIGQFAIRCNSCTKVITKELLDGKYCSFCGNPIDESEFAPKPYRPAGVAKMMETIIEKLGKDVRLSRMGPNSWDVEEGSATIRITYNQQNGFIYNDAVLCTLPQENIGKAYEYMLRENYNMQGNSFSIWQQKIILGSVVHNEDLTEDTGAGLYQRLFQKADHYDDILVNQYGCGKIEED